MGCNTSKSSSFATLQVERERIPFRSLSMSNYRTAAPPKEAGLQYNTHTVALTSSTYGIMKLDRKRHKKMMKMSSKDLEEEEEIEIIDVWELMKGLEEDRTPTTKSSLEEEPHYFYSTQELDVVNAVIAAHVRNNLSFSVVHDEAAQSAGRVRMEEEQDFTEECTPPSTGQNRQQECTAALNTGQNHQQDCTAAQSMVQNHHQLEAADGFLEGSSSNDINLFDPNILADFADSFERNSEASDCCKKMSSSKVSPIDDEERKGSPLDHPHPLASYELKCPPGGEERVVLYSTSLRGIRQTFENCNNVRMILESFNVHVDERDVSMHAGFREELKALIGKPIVSVPRVFINGYYIGGAEEVIELHEDGLLLHLVETLPVQTSRQICDCCGGIRFVPCTECSGSCKILTHSTNKVSRCPYCNENGLIRCTLCF
ncbi:unnamed protein product [Sphagnum troendelagicum]|uniref:Glutaredoxin domain-containing protein n=1 Tax=Sphagnum troendelagicum TaxID=128251 RepID=A0ABP0TYD9_9BRYO